MPYTLAHPAAALPFWYGSRRQLPLAALAIGAASPDFEFFLTMNTRWTYSHTLLGLFWVCLPSSALVLWLYNRWGRRGVAYLLPREWPFPLVSPPSSRALTVVAILIGALTHLAWDAFTHGYGVAVQALPVLQTTALELRGHAIPWFKVLQHGGTLTGLSTMAALAARWAWHQPRPEWAPFLRRVILFGVFLAAAGVANGLRITHGDPFAEQGRAFFVSGGVAVTFALGAGLVALGWQQQRVDGHLTTA